MCLIFDKKKRNLSASIKELIAQHIESFKKLKSTYCVFFKSNSISGSSWKAPVCQAGSWFR